MQAWCYRLTQTFKKKGLKSMKVYFNCHVRELAASCIDSVEPLSGHFTVTAAVQFISMQLKTHFCTIGIVNDD